MFDQDPGEIESYPCQLDGCDGRVVQVIRPGGGIGWECDRCDWSPAGASDGEEKMDTVELTEGAIAAVLLTLAKRIKEEGV